MAEIAVPLAIGSAVAGTGLAAAGHVMAGREQSMAASFESQQKDRQEQEFKIAAAQTEARRREHLTSSLETIQSIRAGRGVGEGSPTAMASFNEIISDESRDIRTERLNYLSKAEQARLASQMSKRQAKMSLLSGYMSAGADVAGGIFKAATLSAGPWGSGSSKYSSGGSAGKGI